MGVRTRPGIKHDHRHNQQWEALAEQHRNGIGPRSPPAAGWYLGLRWRHRLLPRGGQGNGLAPLPGWMLDFGQCWGLFLPPGCGALRGPSGSPAPVPREWAVCAPGAAAVLGCGAQPCRSTCKLWLFLYIFRFIFLLFWQQTYPCRCPGESKTVHGGLLPCQPLTQGSEPLRGRDRGQEPDLCPPAEPNPLAGAGNLGY